MCGENRVSKRPSSTHIQSPDDLVTPYEQTRAGFVAMALEKCRKATPYVEEAKALKASVSTISSPYELIAMVDIRPAVLTAAGVSDKAAGHLGDENQTEAIRQLVKQFLEPAGPDFVDELIYRFLLTRGDSLGGSMRNLAGMLGERKMTRALLSALTTRGCSYSWLHSTSREWIPATDNNADIEIFLRGLSWRNGARHRTLMYNLNVPLVGNNVDLCLFSAKADDYAVGQSRDSCHHQPGAYLALCELKGGIDPSGADEHWKTANSALRRIRNAFSAKDLHPHIFFVGAAIEQAMAVEIHRQLMQKHLSNAANLTNDVQLAALCAWLVSL